MAALAIARLMASMRSLRSIDSARTKTATRPTIPPEVATVSLWLSELILDLRVRNDVPPERERRQAVET